MVNKKYYSAFSFDDEERDCSKILTSLIEDHGITTKSLTKVFDVSHLTISLWVTFGDRIPDKRKVEIVSFALFVESLNFLPSLEKSRAISAEIDRRRMFRN